MDVIWLYLSTGMDDHKANMKNSLVQNRDFGKLILPLAVIGLMLRAAYLTARPIWYDEAITIFFAQSGISYIGQHFWHGSNPPLAYFIYAAWGYVFGPSQMSYEWVSVLFGAASLYWIYRTGKTLFDEQAGFFALLLLAFSSYHLFVSQQIRSYSMTCFFVLLSIEQLFRYYQTGKRINLWGWIAGSLLMLASHFYTVFLFAVEIGFLLIHLVDPARKKINTARNIYGGLAAFLLAFLIAIYPILHKHGVFQFYPRPFAGLGDLLLTLQSVLFLSKPLVVLSLGLVAWCLYQGMRKGSGNEFHLDHRRAVHFLCVWVLISLTIPFLFSQFVPSFFYVRYYIFTHLAWVLLTAFSISRIRQESVRAAVAAIFIFMLSLLIGDYYRECQEKKELKLMYQAIEREYRSGDVILHENGWTFGPSYFYHGGRLDEFFLTDEFGLPNLQRRKLDTSTLRSYRRLWLFLEMPDDIQKINQAPWFQQLPKQIIQVSPNRQLYLFDLMTR